MNPRSLYVHVPFCARRCTYCDFAVEALRDPPVEAWLAAIGEELRLTSLDQGWDVPLRLDTLYVGGGTPSLLGTGAMCALRDRIAPVATLGPGAEWTCEANPESFTDTLAADWRTAGVNRISLGAQTFHERSLRWMGRLHGPDGPARALAAARGAGFDDVSVDLIFGLPDHLGRDWADDLDRVIDLAPEHVSLYGLTAEPGAALGRRVAEGREKLADEDRYADEYLMAHERLTGAGYEHYEVSNFGRTGRHSRHNFAYWTGDPYAAVGPGAHAYFPPVRRWNSRSWIAYRDSLGAGRLPIDGEEVVSDPETAWLETVWLGLRTRIGVEIDHLAAEGQDLVERWVRAGLGEVRDRRVRLTPAGWLLLDELAVALSGMDRIPPRPPVPDGFDDRRQPVQIGATSTRCSG